MVIFAVLNVFWLNLNPNPLTLTPHFCCFDCLLTVFDDLYTVGTVLVDMWRLVHQWSFLLFWLSFDCFWRLVHCWYSLGRPLMIGTPMVLSVFDDWYSVRIVKRQSNSKKWPLVYKSSHVNTESAEYTKPRKLRYLARPPSHVPGQWANDHSPSPVGRAYSVCQPFILLG